MYKIVMGLGSFIRVFLLPNPFEALPKPFSVEFMGSSLVLPAMLLNIIAEPFLHAITFGIVGLYYERGSMPARGSFLYSLFYCIHVFLLWVAAKFSFTALACWLLIAAYIGLHVVCYCIKNRIRQSW